MGGTVDPKTGNVSWHMNVPLEEQLTFYRSHPPRALENLRTTAIEHVDWSFDGHGEPINSIFELACTCGGRLFTVTCGIDPDEEVAPPIALECAACEAAFDIFDANQHGWNAVMCGDTFDEPDISDDLVGNSIGAPQRSLCGSSTRRTPSATATSVAASKTCSRGSRC